MQIRTTKPADTPKLPEIERSAGALFRDVESLAWIADDAVMPEQTHRKLAAQGTSWVAEHDSQIVGFACAESFATELHLWELAVTYSAQGSGVGRALMETLMQHARDGRYHAITLTTFSQVPWNAPFYERLGFERLEPKHQSARLRACLAQEIVAGLPGESRCAMHWLVR